MAAKKSADAFRTISEVADWLGVNAHVLRFWESKFSQIKPVKRAGGRRYYRKADMELLGGIKQLLHEDGLTIKGAQKILREQGVKAVCALSKPVDFDTDAAEAAPSPDVPTPEQAEATPTPEPEPEAVPVAAPALTAEAVLQPDAEQQAVSVEDELEHAQRVADALDEALAQAPSQPSLFDEMKRDHGAADGPEAQEHSAKTPPIAPLPPLPTDEVTLLEDEPDEPFCEAEAPAAATFTEPPTGPTYGATGLAEVGSAMDDAELAEPDEGPAIAPLPVPDRTLTEALARIAPGQIQPGSLAPILDRAKALRARMDAVHAG